MNAKPFLLVFLLSMFVLSCRVFTNHRSQAEWNQIVESARERVLNGAQDLDLTSREMVRTNYPTIGHYGMGTDLSQYGFDWLISSNRTVRLSGQGNIKTLDGSTISIELSPSVDRRYLR